METCMVLCLSQPILHRVLPDHRFRTLPMGLIQVKGSIVRSTHSRVVLRV